MSKRAFDTRLVVKMQMLIYVMCACKWTIFLFNKGRFDSSQMWLTTFSMSISIQVNLIYFSVSLTLLFLSEGSRSIAPLGDAASHEIIQIKGKIPAAHSQPEINHTKTHFIFEIARRNDLDSHFSVCFIFSSSLNLSVVSVVLMIDERNYT